MTARDDLTEVINSARRRDSFGSYIRAEQAADAILAAGYRKPKVIQYMVLTQDGGLYDCNFGLNREAAQAVADQATADAAALGIDYSYRVAEVIESEATK